MKKEDNSLSRCEFLKKSAILGAGLAVTDKIPKRRCHE